MPLLKPTFARASGSLLGLALLLASEYAAAQFQPAPPPPPGAQPPPALPPGPPPPGFQGQVQGQTTLPNFSGAPYAPAPASSRTRSVGEIGALYGVSVAYGVGIGVWLSNEIGIDDPGVFLIPPAVLGLAAPVGVFVLDRPRMDEGLPASIAAGMLIGAGEGLGIAGYQFVSADREDEWGFRGLSRAVALGATLGAVGGYAIGYYQEPPPESSVLVTSGVVWGTLIGSAFGYGASGADLDYGMANDSAALGGLIGYNVGLAGSAVFSVLMVPSFSQIGWMWAGAGIGAAVSLPVFLFYTGEDSPPAKRGLVFTGTAMSLGLVAGGLFASGSKRLARAEPPLSSPERAFARIETLVPRLSEDSIGLELWGSLE